MAVIKRGEENMEIAPRITRKDWLKLNLSSKDNPDWDKAVEIFRSRIQERYLEPVNIIIQKDSTWKPKYGFSILAIDCLLIETLQAFREGKTDTNRTSKQTFRNFLTMTDSFKNHFDNEKANKFYEHFRCGILHQSEIKENSLVKTNSNLPLVSWEPDDNKMIINRRKFHDLLVKEFDNYIEQLKMGDAKLRKNFITKMNYICRVSDEVE